MAIKITKPTVDIGERLSIAEGVSLENFKAMDATFSGNVGIRNNDPNLPLTITSNSGANAIAIRARSDDDYGFIQFYNHAGTALRGQIFNHNGAMSISTSTTGTVRLHIDTSGNVGIGRTSIAQPSSGATTLAIQGTSTTKGGAIQLYSSDDSVAAYIYADNVSGLSINTSTSHPMVFRTAAAEAMRIDSAGLLMVSTSADFASGTVDGIIAQGTNKPAAAFSNTATGQIVKFYEGASLVGTIGTKSGNLYIGTGGTGLRFNVTDKSVYGADTATGTGAESDGTISLGVTGARFKDLHLSGGVVFGDAGGSGTPTSNTLDSYEEGTWTPTLVGGTSGSATLTVSSANYTRVGNKVFAACYLDNVNLSDDTIVGSMRIGGLPFSGASRYTQAASITYQTISTTYPNLSGYIQTSQIIINQNMTTTTLARSDCVSTSGRDIMIGVTYITA